MSKAVIHVLKLPSGIPGDDYENSFMRKNWILKDPESKVSIGDIVYFPENLSGAGEFEGVFFVLTGGAEDPSLKQLVLGDVEYLAFPQPICDLVPDLKSHYRSAFKSLIDSQTGPDFEETFEGCDDGEEGFWNSPVKARIRNKEDSVTFIYDECIQKTITPPDYAS